MWFRPAIVQRWAQSRKPVSAHKNQLKDRLYAVTLKWGLWRRTFFYTYRVSPPLYPILLTTCLVFETVPSPRKSFKVIFRPKRSRFVNVCLLFPLHPVIYSSLQNLCRTDRELMLKCSRGSQVLTNAYCGLCTISHVLRDLTLDCSIHRVLTWMYTAIHDCQRFLAILTGI